MFEAQYCNFGRHNIQHNDTQRNAARHNVMLGVRFFIVLLSVAFFHCFAEVVMPSDVILIAAVLNVVAPFFFTSEVCNSMFVFLCLLTQQ